MSSDGEKAKIRTITKNDLVLPWPIFWPAWRRESTLAYKSTILSLRKIHQEVENFELNRSRLGSLQVTKNHQAVEDSEDESDALRYFLSLAQKLASNQLHTSSSNLCQGKPQQEDADRILVENNLDTSVTWQSKFSVVFFFTIVMFKCTIITLLRDDLNLNAFQTF